MGDNYREVSIAHPDGGTVLSGWRVYAVLRLRTDRDPIVQAHHGYARDGATGDERLPRPGPPRPGFTATVDLHSIFMVVVRGRGIRGD